MIFLEQKTEHNYIYKTEEVFGKLEIYSKEKLNAEKLDQVFMSIWKIADNNTSQIVEGDVQGKDITYKLTKENPWQDIEEDNE